MSELPISDMDANLKITTDHKTIREWAESRNGQPARGSDGKLFIAFKDDSGKALMWEEFFAELDNGKLAFACREDANSGDSSKKNTFNMVVSLAHLEKQHQESEGY